MANLLKPFVLALMLFFMPLAFSSAMAESFRLVKDGFASAVVLLGAMAGFGAALWRRQAVRLSLPWLLFLAFTIYSACLVPRVAETDMALREMTRMFTCLVFYGLLLNWLNTQNDLLLSVKIMVHGGAFSALVGLWQVAFFAKPGNPLPFAATLLPPSLRFFIERSDGTMGNANILAEHLLLTLPLAVVLALREKQPLNRLGFLAISLVISAALLSTGSKAGVVSAGVALGVIALFYAAAKMRDQRRPQALFLLGAAACLAGLLFFTPRLATPLISRFNPNPSGKILAGRREIPIPTPTQNGSTPKTELLERKRFPTAHELYPRWMAHPPTSAGFAARALTVPRMMLAQLLAMPTSQARLTWWRIGAVMLRQSPLTGIGPAGFNHRYALLQGAFFEDPRNSYLGAVVWGLPVHPHNELLQIRLEQGIPGLLLFLGVFLFVGAKCCLAFKQTGDFIFAALLAGMVAIGLEGLTQFPFHVAPTAYLAFALVSLADRFSAPDKPGSFPRLHHFDCPMPSLPKWALGVVFPALVVLGGWLFLHACRPVVASFALRRSEQFLAGAKQTSQTLQQHNTQLVQARQSSNPAQEQALSATMAQLSTQREALFDQAILWNFKGLSAEPSNHGLWFQMGSAFLTQAALQKLEDPGHDATDTFLSARKALRQAVVITDTAQARHNLALAQWGSGQRRVALASLERARYLDPFNMPTYLLAIDFLAKLGERQKATQWIAAARATQPDTAYLAALDAREQALNANP